MRPNCRAFNEVETRHEILKYKSSIITGTGNRDLGTYLRSKSDNLNRWCYRPSRTAIINSFNYQRYVLELKKCITAEIWNTLKHKRNAKPTLIGAVDGGTGTLGSRVSKLILYTSLSLVRISNRNQRCLRKNFLHNAATTASAIISYFARKGELLFTNSDQIEADRLCELSKKEKKSVHYMNI